MHFDLRHGGLSASGMKKSDFVARVKTAGVAVRNHMSPTCLFSFC